MPVSEADWGTYNLGDWGYDADRDIRTWRSTTDDPYNGMIVSSVLLRHVSGNDMDARRLAGELWGRGVAVVVKRGGEEQVYLSALDMIGQWEISRSPMSSSWLRLLVESWKPRVFDTLVEVMRDRDNVDGHDFWVCVSPYCYRVMHIERQEGGPLVHQCPGCGNYTMVHESCTGSGVAPYLQMPAMYRNSTDSIISCMDAWDRAIGIADGTDLVMFDFHDRYGWSLVMPLDPHLKPTEPHHITKRTNLKYFQDKYNPRVIGTPRGDAFMWRMRDVLQWDDGRIQDLFNVISRYVENPNEILDESKAATLRQELIAERWHDRERAAFRLILTERGIVRAGQAPQNVLVDMIYNSAMNSAGKRVVIKRKGGIEYHLAAAVNALRPDIIESAYEITETPGDPQEIFNYDALR